MLDRAIRRSIVVQELSVLRIVARRKSSVSLNVNFIKATHASDNILRECEGM